MRVQQLRDAASPSRSGSRMRSLLRMPTARSDELELLMMHTDSDGNANPPSMLSEVRQQKSFFCFFVLFLFLLVLFSSLLSTWFLRCNARL